MSSKAKGKTPADDNEERELVSLLFPPTATASLSDPSEATPAAWARDANGDLDWSFTAKSVKVWSESALLSFIYNNAFSIPARDYNPSAPFVHVRFMDTDDVTLPHGYRLPLMFVGKYIWEGVLSSLRDEAKWMAARTNLFHLARLCQNLLSRAKVRGMKGPMEKGWRCLMFDRLLARFYKHWAANDPKRGPKFVIAHSAKEYDRDVLKHDWKRWCLRGFEAVRMTEDEVINGMNFDQYRNVLRKSGDAWVLDDQPLTFITNEPGHATASSMTSELTECESDEDEDQHALTDRPDNDSDASVIEVLNSPSEPYWAELPSDNDVTEGQTSLKRGPSSIEDDRSTKRVRIDEGGPSTSQVPSTISPLNLSNIFPPLAPSPTHENSEESLMTALASMSALFAAPPTRNSGMENPVPSADTAGSSSKDQGVPAPSAQAVLPAPVVNSVDPAPSQISSIPTPSSTTADKNATPTPTPIPASSSATTSNGVKGANPRSPVDLETPSGSSSAPAASSSAVSATLKNMFSHMPGLWAALGTPASSSSDTTVVPGAPMSLATSTSTAPASANPYSYLASPAMWALGPHPTYVDPSTLIHGSFDGNRVAYGTGPFRMPILGTLPSSSVSGEGRPPAQGSASAASSSSAPANNSRKVGSRPIKAPSNLPVTLTTPMSARALPKKDKAREKGKEKEVPSTTPSASRPAAAPVDRQKQNSPAKNGAPDAASSQAALKANAVREESESSDTDSNASSSSSSGPKKKKKGYVSGRDAKRRRVLYWDRNPMPGRGRRSATAAAAASEAEGAGAGGTSVSAGPSARRGSRGAAKDTSTAQGMSASVGPVVGRPATQPDAHPPINTIVVNARPIAPAPARDKDGAVIIASAPLGTTTEAPRPGAREGDAGKGGQKEKDKSVGKKPGEREKEKDANGKDKQKTPAEKAKSTADKGKERESTGGGTQARVGNPVTSSVDRRVQPSTQVNGRDRALTLLLDLIGSLGQPDRRPIAAPAAPRPVAPQPATPVPAPAGPSSPEVAAAVASATTATGAVRDLEARFQTFEGRYLTVREELTSLVGRLAVAEKEVKDGFVKVNQDIEVDRKTFIEWKESEAVWKMALEEKMRVDEAEKEVEAEIPEIQQEQEKAVSDEDGDVEMADNQTGAPLANQPVYVELAIQTEEVEEPKEAQEDKASKPPPSEEEQVTAELIGASSTFKATNDPRAQELRSNLSTALENMVSTKLLTLFQTLATPQSKPSDSESGIDTPTHMESPESSTLLGSVLSAAQANGTNRPRTPDHAALNSVAEEMKVLRDESMARELRMKEELQAMRQLHSAEIDALRRRLSYLESQPQARAIENGAVGLYRPPSTSSLAPQHSPPHDLVPGPRSASRALSEVDALNGHHHLDRDDSISRTFSPPVHSRVGSHPPEHSVNSSVPKINGLLRSGSSNGVAVMHLLPTPTLERNHIPHHRMDIEEDGPLPIKSQRKQHVYAARANLG